MGCFRFFELKQVSHFKLVLIIFGLVGVPNFLIFKSLFYLFAHRLVVFHVFFFVLCKKVQNVHE